MYDGNVGQYFIGWRQIQAVLINAQAHISSSWTWRKSCCSSAAQQRASQGQLHSALGTAMCRNEGVLAMRLRAPIAYCWRPPAPLYRYTDRCVVISVLTAQQPHLKVAY